MLAYRKKRCIPTHEKNVGESVSGFENTLEFKNRVVFFFFYSHTTWQEGFVRLHQTPKAMINVSKNLKTHY